MKTIILTLVLLLVGNISFAQEDEIEDGSVITFRLKDSSVVYGYPNIKKNFVSLHDPLVSDGRDFGQGDKSFFYYDNTGIHHFIDREKIDSVIVADNSFYFMQIKNSGSMFWNKVAENSSYILYDNGSLFKVYDKKKDNFVDIGFSEHSLPGKYGYGKDVKNYEKRIQPYFSDCADFLKLVQENLKQEKYTEENTIRYFGFKLFNGISNYQCD
jgi:hypothetical protein